MRRRTIVSNIASNNHLLSLSLSLSLCLCLSVCLSECEWHSSISPACVQSRQIHSTLTTASRCICDDVMRHVTMSSVVCQLKDAQVNRWTHQTNESLLLLTQHNVYTQLSVTAARVIGLALAHQPQQQHLLGPESPPWSWESTLVLRVHLDLDSQRQNQNRSSSIRVR